MACHLREIASLHLIELQKSGHGLIALAKAVAYQEVHP